MPKSNGRAMTWARHDEMLGGRLQQVVNAIQRIPGIVERNERRLQWLAERQRSVMDALTPKPTERGVPAEHEEEASQEVNASP